MNAPSDTQIRTNLNTECFVKLTQAGEEQYLKYLRDLKIPAEYVELPDFVGDTRFRRFQLWELMLIFGELLYNGQTLNSMPFEESNIYWRVP